MSLFDTGSKGIKFSDPGDTITGTVAGTPREQQQTVFGTTNPDFWPNGDPKMQILVPLQTELSDDENDDGARTLYVASKHLKRAIGQAIHDAKATDLETGGTLTVTFTGYDQQSKNPANPAKLYTATYVKPTGPLTQPATSATTPAAVQKPGLDADVEGKVRQLIGLGLDDDKIAAALANFGVDQTVVAALRS